MAAASARAVMGFLVDPPRPVEGDFVAVFAQTEVADSLAIDFLRDLGIDARVFPIMGDLASEGFAGMFGGSALFGGEGLVCVPKDRAEEALDALEFDSGLVEDEPGEIEQDEP